MSAKQAGKGDNPNRNGFDSRQPKGRPAPLNLLILPYQATVTVATLEFTPAKPSAITFTK